VSPELYGLRKKKKELTRAEQRKLVLTAKVIQNIANEIVTSEKENYLSEIGGFVQESIDKVREWAAQYLVRSWCTLSTMSRFRTRTQTHKGLDC
jgi:hypothetical protein